MGDNMFFKFETIDYFLGGRGGIEIAITNLAILIMHFLVWFVSIKIKQKTITRYTSPLKLIPKIAGVA